MTDLADTLRAIACQQGGEELYQSRIEWKAADEIELLTAANGAILSESTEEIERLRADVATWKEKARYCATEVLNDWELGRLSVDSKQAAEFIIAALSEDEEDD